VIFKEDLEKIFGDRPFQRDPEPTSGNGHEKKSTEPDPTELPAEDQTTT